MSQIKLLHIEDREDDRILVAEVVRAAGFEADIRYVMTEGELRDSLARHRPDLVICDHRLPGLDALRAHEIIRDCRVQAPVIVFTAVALGREFRALNNVPDCTLISKEDLWLLQEQLHSLCSQTMN